jgi:hypothetical protein
VTERSPRAVIQFTNMSTKTKIHQSTGLYNGKGAYGPFDRTTVVDTLTSTFNTQLEELRDPVKERVATFFGCPREPDELRTWIPVIGNIVWQAFRDAYRMGFELGWSANDRVSEMLNQGKGSISICYGKLKKN